MIGVSSNSITGGLSTLCDSSSSLTCRIKSAICSSYAKVLLSALTLGRKSGCCKTSARPLNREGEIEEINCGCENNLMFVLMNETI